MLQLIPAHCNITGNKNVDRLTKEGGKLDQEEREVTYKEAKQNCVSQVEEEVAETTSQLQHRGQILPAVQIKPGGAPED